MSDSGPQAWLTGGCLCGSLRYRFDPRDALVDLCHCGMCRRSTGGVLVGWAQVRPDRFVVNAGSPSVFRSSPGLARHFCGRCGTQVHMTDDAGRSIGITLGSLDDIEALRPAAHGWDSARPTWLCLADELPRFAADPDYDIS